MEEKGEEEYGVRGGDEQRVVWEALWKCGLVGLRVWDRR
jgi:hypothetical protein